METWNAETPSHRFDVPEKTFCRFCLAATEARVSFPLSPPLSAHHDECPSCRKQLTEDAREARRCPFCNASAWSEQTRAASVPQTLEQLQQTLACWARLEGLASEHELLSTYFVLGSIEEVFAALQRNDRIETTFDVSAFLFSSGVSFAGTAEEALDTTHAPTPLGRSTTKRNSYAPSDALLALASVVAADGNIAPEELAFLSQAAQRLGVAPPSPEQLRVWRPVELTAPPSLEERERLIDMMLQIALHDGELDASELQVVRAFARAWGVDPVRIEKTIALKRQRSRGFGAWLRRAVFQLVVGR